MSIDVGAWTLGLAVLMAGCGGTWVGGIHARMGWSASGGLRVVDVPEGPARTAGLRPGDRIVAIDGQSVHDIVFHRTGDGIVVLDGEATPTAADARERLDERLRGSVGSRVTLRVMRDEQTVDLRVERAPYARGR